MSYVTALENLRKSIQNQDPVQAAQRAVVPTNPRGFAPAVRSPQNVAQTPQYEPLNFARSTMREIQMATQRFKDNLAQLREREQQAASRRNSGFLASSSQPDAPESPAEPATDVEGLFEGVDSRTDRGAPTGPAGAPVEVTGELTLTGELAAVARSIQDIESSGNYRARGPVVQSGRYAGERALGAYQVMPGNLPQWSMQALGREVSEQEFLDSPEIQDAIFADQMTRNRERYGSWEDAASVWFTGRPVRQAGNASDGFMAVPEYIQRFRNNMDRYR